MFINLDSTGEPNSQTYEKIHHVAKLLVILASGLKSQLHLSKLFL